MEPDTKDNEIQLESISISTSGNRNIDINKKQQLTDSSSSHRRYYLSLKIQLKISFFFALLVVCSSLFLLKDSCDSNIINLNYNDPKNVINQNTLSFINSTVNVNNNNIHVDKQDLRSGINLSKEYYSNIINAYEDSRYEILKPSKVNATLVTLARNSDLWTLVDTIRSVEDRFNNKFHYDWIFLNDEDFTDEFINVTSSLISGLVKYGTIPREQWSYPAHIDLKKAERSRKLLANQAIVYADSESYRHMCRYQSGFLWKHPLLSGYDYYWRIDSDVKYHCDIDYDVFRYMSDNNKTYGFTISLYETPATIPGLWRTVKRFLKKHKRDNIVHPNSLIDFISSNKGNTYNYCHFWTNFEIADLNFFRSEVYQSFFNYLDQEGGFFYERWGDAPIHSIAISLFEDRDKIHYFDDIGYTHDEFSNCPIDTGFRTKHRCSCNPKKDFTWRGYSCTNKYFDAKNLTRPAGWEDYT